MAKKSKPKSESSSIARKHDIRFIQVLEQLHFSINNNTRSFLGAIAEHFKKCRPIQSREQIKLFRSTSFEESLVST